uniref:Uncharacterized protein n=1 Tax=Zea mays TaxID=4577 RepID=A0A804PF06_MAIZE
MERATPAAVAADDDGQKTSWPEVVGWVTLNAALQISSDRPDVSTDFYSDRDHPAADRLRPQPRHHRRRRPERRRQDSGHRLDRASGSFEWQRFAFHGTCTVHKTPFRSTAVEESVASMLSVECSASAALAIRSSRSR